LKECRKKLMEKIRHKEREMKDGGNKGRNKKKRK
jgi:hypothetical protein